MYPAAAPSQNGSRALLGSLLPLLRDTHQSAEGAVLPQQRIQGAVGNGDLKIIEEDDPDIFYRDRP